MKKIYLITSLVISAIGFAQCMINGSSKIQINQTETYTVENDNAQCPDCHLWVTVGGNSVIDGEFRKNTVKIKPTSGGRTVLSLSMLTAQGLAQCSKNIDIVDVNGQAPASSANSTASNLDPNCDINVSNFKEVKYGDGVVSFFPIQEEVKDYKYTWTATYQNGEKKESTEKVPQFNYSEQNPITEVKIKIFSGICLRSFTKTYENNYWKFFK